MQPNKRSPDVMAGKFQSLPPTRSLLNVQFERIDPLVGPLWDSHVTPRPDHSVFHRSAWARVLAETYGHDPFYLRFVISGTEVALVPLMEVRSPVTGRRGVSLPFSDSAGLIWTAPCQETIVYHLLRELAAERKWLHLELRGGSPPESDAGTFRSYRSHELDLSPGIDLLARRLPASTRRSIRKSGQSGLNITVGNDRHDMATFYQLHRRTRRRHGLPPQPFAFFEAIGRHLIESGLGTIVLARHSGKTVAGAVFLHSGNRAIYKFGASEQDHWSMRPNHSVMWSAIQHLVQKGCLSLDFGRTANTDAGLIRFKQSWGGTDGTLDYYRYHTSKQAWMTDAKPPTDSLPFVFAHLPLFLNQLAGSLIYPHLD
jgi:CelD/BcsL family acetyltransferase involved in cellulose biosynthesis